MTVKYYANRFSLFIVLSIFSLLVLQCTVPSGPVFQKDGRIYGKVDGQWGGRWWNYYQRGLSYAQGGFWDYAIRDFQQAIKQRFADQRRARTYGLHILDDYFPHRELGIVFYHQKRFDESIAELETSLKQFESAKTKYFLNLARQGLLETSGLDLYPPKLFISSPKSGSSTRFSSLSVSGQVVDDQYVSSVYMNKEKIPLELSSPNIFFDPEIKLRRGKNIILVEAMDLVGKKVQEEVVVFCDQEAPLIYIDSLNEDYSKEGYTIEGYVSDMSGVEGFWLNGQPVDFQKDEDGGFFTWFFVSDLTQLVIFEAQDKLGNYTRGEFFITDLLDVGNHYKEGFPRLTSSAPDLKGILAQKERDSSASRIADRGEPVVRVKDIPDSLTVDWKECFIEGEVADTKGVSAVIINGTPLITRTTRIVFFNFLIPLMVGDNLITIQAENLSGVVVTKQLHIYRKLNPVHEIGSRWNLAVFPFKYRGEKAELKDLIYESVIQNFVEQARFQIVEREKIDGLLNKEQDKKENVIELGRLIAAEGILLGSAYFDDNHLELIARVVDTETTVVVDSEEVFGPVDSLKDIHHLTEGLSVKFKQAFPEVEGRVIGEDSDMIQVGLGANERVLPYMKVLYFKEVEPIRLAGSEKILEKRLIIMGEGRITNVYNSYSDTIVLSKKEGTRIKVQDWVITK